MKFPLKPKHSQCNVISDSREQLPYDLSPLSCEVGTLPTGDYGLAGEFSQLVCVERKSLSDFIGSCTGGRERFDREIQRMLAYTTRVIVVESTWSEIEQGDWRAKATPQTIKASITSFHSRGVPVFLAGDRKGGQKFTGGLLWRCWLHEYRRIRQVAKTLA